MAVTVSDLRSYLGTIQPAPAPTMPGPSFDGLAVALAIKSLFASPKGNEVQVSTGWAPVP